MLQMGILKAETEVSHIIKDKSPHGTFYRPAWEHTTLFFFFLFPLCKRASVLNITSDFPQSSGLYHIH